MIIPAAMMGLPWNQTVLISFKRTLQTLITRSLFSSVSSTITLVYTIKQPKLSQRQVRAKGKSRGIKSLKQRNVGGLKRGTRKRPSRDWLQFFLSLVEGMASARSIVAHRTTNSMDSQVPYDMQLRKIFLQREVGSSGKKRVAYLCGIWGLGPCPAVPGPSFFLCSQPAVSLYSRDGSRDTFTSTWVRGKVLDMWLRQRFHERFSLI